MPFYEYQCQECGEQVTALQKMSDLPLQDCAACGRAALKKLISAAGFQLKGSGWYATDFKGGNKTSTSESKTVDTETKAAESKSDTQPKTDTNTANAAKPA